MNRYFKLMNKPTFRFHELASLSPSKEAAYSYLNRMVKKGYIQKIRNDLYTCANPMIHSQRVDKYTIAMEIHDDAYLTHQSAFEFMGYCNPVINTLYVASTSRFRSFFFDGITYEHVSSKLNIGVVETHGTRYTSIERTIVDSIHDVNKIGGRESLLESLSLIESLDETALMEILDAYGIQSLYQKTGYLLQKHQKSLGLSDAFFEECRSKMGSSPSYFLVQESESKRYFSDWKVVSSENESNEPLSHEVLDEG
jgi:predicted transcriptional regulator of viral defense system